MRVSFQFAFEIISFVLIVAKQYLYSPRLTLLLNGLRGRDMKEIFYGALLFTGVVVGWFVNDTFFNKDKPVEKIHFTLSQAIKQSKISLAREDFAENFYLCQQKNMSPNNWKALVLSAYSFQYGIDAAQIETTPLDGDEQTATKFRVTVKKIEALSAELKTIKAFTLEKAWLRNEQRLISDSKDELVARAPKLALYRLEADPEHKIYGLIRESIRDTVQNLSLAVGRKIEVTEIVFPESKVANQKSDNLNISYQCGDITPIFSNGHTFSAKMSLPIGVDLPQSSKESKTQVEFELIDLPKE